MSPNALIFVTYLIVGPLAWLLLAIGIRMGRHRMDRLARRQQLTAPSPAPAVTVLVPAKDEAARIATCIESILSQDYPRFFIIAIDDRSTDGTGAVLDELARKNQRLRVIHIQPGSLPQGWLGKCHALHVGAQQAQAPWLLFIDSDVTLEPDAISLVLAQAAGREYAAVSLLTRLECHSFWERLLLPLLASAWAIMHTISLTNEIKYRHIAAANGQFFLIRRDAYEKVGGHGAVRNQITEDVELMRLLKGAGLHVRFYSGDHLASTRMHATFRQMFNGWGRIFSGTSRRRPWRIVGAITFLLVSSLSAYLATAWGVYDLFATASWWWLIAAGVHLTIITAVVSRIYRWSGNPQRNALIFPIASAVILAMLAFALRLCRTGRVSWRGTEYDARQMQQSNSTSS